MMVKLVKEICGLTAGWLDTLLHARTYQTFAIPEDFRSRIAIA